MVNVDDIRAHMAVDCFPWTTRKKECYTRSGKTLKVDVAPLQKGKGDILSIRPHDPKADYLIASDPRVGAPIEQANQRIIDRLTHTYTADMPAEDINIFFVFYNLNFEKSIKIGTKDLENYLLEAFDREIVSKGYVILRTHDNRFKIAAVKYINPTYARPDGMMDNFKKLVEEITK